MCRRKYSPLTRRLSKWIYPIIDRSDWGIKEIDHEKPRFAYGKDLLDAARASSRYWQIRRITMTNVEQHLKRETTCYFTSRSASSKHLLMVDIDAHHGETDAWEAAGWIVNTFFPGAYWELSTNDRGAHVYLLMDVGHRRRVEFNDYVANAENSLARYLAAVVEDAGFEAQVCGVYGICSIRKDGEIKNRGKLAKIPRPQTISDLERLENMPVFDLCSCQAVVEEALLRELTIERNDLVKDQQINSSVKQQHITVNRLSPRSHSFATQLMKSPSAWERSKGTVMHLAQHLGRLPEQGEVSMLYESLGLGTNLADRDREQRHERAIRSVEQSFDPAKATGYSYTVGQYLDLLSTLISGEELHAASQEVGYSRRLLLEDLDIGLGFHVKQTLHIPEKKQHAFTAPGKGVISWFKELKQSGSITRSCNWGKVRAIRLALVRAKMIILLDDNYKPGFATSDGVGIAKRWGLGEKCPQYQEYLALMTMVACNESVKTQSPIDQPLVQASSNQSGETTIENDIAVAIMSFVESN